MSKCEPSEDKDKNLAEDINLNKTELTSTNENHKSIFGVNCGSDSSITITISQKKICKSRENSSHPQFETITGCLKCCDNDDQPIALKSCLSNERFFKKCCKRNCNLTAKSLKCTKDENKCCKVKNTCTCYSRSIQPLKKCVCNQPTPCSASCQENTRCRCESCTPHKIKSCDRGTQYSKDHIPAAFVDQTTQYDTVESKNKEDDCKFTKDSYTQYKPVEYKNAGTQPEFKCIENKSTQYDVTSRDSTTQKVEHKCLKDSSTQYDLTQSRDSTTQQQDCKCWKHTSTQYEPVDDTDQECKCRRNTSTRYDSVECKDSSLEQPECTCRKNNHTQCELEKYNGRQRESKLTKENSSQYNRKDYKRRRRNFKLLVNSFSQYDETCRSNLSLNKYLTPSQSSLLDSSSEILDILKNSSNFSVGFEANCEEFEGQGSGRKRLSQRPNIRLNRINSFLEESKETLSSIRETLKEKPKWRKSNSNKDNKCSNNHNYDQLHGVKKAIDKNDVCGKDKNKNDICQSSISISTGKEEVLEIKSKISSNKNGGTRESVKYIKLCSEGNGFVVYKGSPDKKSGKPQWTFHEESWSCSDEQSSRSLLKEKDTCSEQTHYLPLPIPITHECCEKPKCKEEKTKPSAQALVTKDTQTSDLCSIESVDSCHKKEEKQHPSVGNKGIFVYIPCEELERKNANKRIIELYAALGNPDDQQNRAPIACQLKEIGKYAGQCLKRCWRQLSDSSNDNNCDKKNIHSHKVHCVKKQRDKQSSKDKCKKDSKKLKEEKCFMYNVAANDFEQIIMDAAACKILSVD